MRQSRFTEQQIVPILEEGQKGDQTVEELCRKQGIHKQTYNGWKQKYSGMIRDDLQRLKQLEQENGRLKRALADAMLDNQILKELNSKNGRASDLAGSGGVGRRALPGSQRAPYREAHESPEKFFAIRLQEAW